MDKKVLEVIDSEIEYAKRWDKLPSFERPQKDSDKSVEFWLLHIERYLHKAQESCYGTDKTERSIRKYS